MHKREKNHDSFTNGCAGQGTITLPDITIHIYNQYNLFLHQTCLCVILSFCLIYVRVGGLLKIKCNTPPVTINHYCDLPDGQQRYTA